MPNDISVIDFIYDILDKNNLRGPQHAWIEMNNKESRAIIMRDAALVLFQKKIPEKKLVEFLEKHLETSTETAEKVVEDIRENLVPYIKITSTENSETEGQKEKYRQELLKKISISRNTPIESEEKETPMSYYKKLDITDVEKNAEKMKQEGKNIMTEEKNKFQRKSEEDKKPQNITPDTYREPIE